MVHKFEFLKGNSLSRSDLTLEKTEVGNVHYGDILIKYGEVLRPKVDLPPSVIEPDDHRQSLGTELQIGDVIFADAAEDRAVGKCVELQESIFPYTKIVPGLHTIACRPAQKYASGFLGYYLNSNSFRNQLLGIMQGTKVLSISTKGLSTSVIRQPCLDEQASISVLFSHISDLITLHQCHVGQRETNDYNCKLLEMPTWH